MLDLWLDEGITKEIIDGVFKEHVSQQKKWGIQERNSFEWLGYATEELGELSAAINDYKYNNGGREEVVNEATHAATLLLKIATMFNSKQNT